MQYLPVRIIARKRCERGYISDDHLNQTGQLPAILVLFIP